MENKVIRASDFQLQKEFLELLNLCFPKKWGNEDYFTWKYINKEQLSLKSNIWFTEFNNELTGFIGFIPVKLRIYMKDYNVVQAVDAVTNTNYRRKGIFNYLTKQSYEDASTEGFSLTYGVGKEESKKGLLEKGNWSNWVTFIRYVVSFTSDNKIKNLIYLIIVFIVKHYILILNKFDNKEYIFRIENELPKEKEIANVYGIFSKQFDILFDRNIEYLRWRTSNPKSNFKYFTLTKENGLVGMLIVNHNVIDGTYIVEDYAYTEEKYFGLLIKKLILDSINNKIIKIKIDFNRNKSIKYGLLNVLFRKKIDVTYIIRNMNLTQEIFEDITNTPRIHITRLDKNE